MAEPCSQPCQIQCRSSTPFSSETLTGGGSQNRLPVFGFFFDFVFSGPWAQSFGWSQDHCAIWPTMPTRGVESEHYRH